MSTTVTYKGSTLTTVNNQTRTLETAGKYLEDDITLTDVSQGSPTLQNKTVHPSSSDQSITADVGYDGLGTVTAKAVTTTNLTAANIVSGVTVEVGDADDSDRILSVTGAASAGDPNENARKLVANQLTSFIDDTVTTLATNAFYAKSSLSVLQVHNVTSINGGFLGGSASSSSPTVQYVAFPKVTSISGNGANNSRNVKGMDFTALNSIAMYGFSTNQAMNMLVLRKDSVTALNATSAFSDTPFASGKTGGTLYVPQSLISSYQGASNWSTILGYTNNQIKSIESTHTDPTAPIDLTLYYADGTLIPT